MSADTARLSTQHNKLGKPGGPGLFHDKSLQLPAYIQNIAKALMRNGKPKSQAIQIAIGTVKKWAAGGGGVGPEVKAAAAKAVAEWEAAKAKAHATPNKGGGGARLSNEGGGSPFVDLAGPDVSNKGMIALEVPEGTIAEVPGGIAVGDMHVTLQYLGDDVSDVDFAKAIRQAYSAAAEVGPVSGWLGGLGVFPADDEGKVAVWCPVDVPGIDKLHLYSSTGESDHAFVPHVTLRWGKEGQKLPDPVPRTPVTFTHVLVKRGEQTIRLPLTNNNDMRYTNPLAATGRAVELARPADAGTQPAKGKQKPPPKPRAGVGKDGGPARFKHGWIPVDKNGNATGPAEMPPWLKKAHQAQKDAGGRTFEQIQNDKAAKEKQRHANAAAAPAKKAAAAADRAKRKAMADKKHAAAQKAAQDRHAAAQKHAADRAATKKAKDREKLVNAAYKQALADRKAGRALSEQQQRVVGYVEQQQKKRAAQLRGVDVPGAPAAGPAMVGRTAKAHKVTPPKPLKPPVLRSPGRASSGRRVRSSVVRMKSFKRQTHLANDDGVNGRVLEFAGAKMPGGQLAFRYKHGWILINPAIPSRGHAAGGLAKAHGHKSGTVTHGHFEPHPSGKGKVFVADRTGGKTAAQKVAEAKQKKAPAVVNGKVNYQKVDKKKLALVAAQKDTAPAAPHTKKPTSEEAHAKSADASKASAKAKESGTVQDAQVAAKKHADAFVTHNKAGNAGSAAYHKDKAQEWQKKANQLKQAEKDTNAAKAKHEAEQKKLAVDNYQSSKKFAVGISKKANENPTEDNHKKAAAAHKSAADQAGHAGLTTEQKTHNGVSDFHQNQATKLANEGAAKKKADIANANKAYQAAFDMPQSTPDEKTAKAQAFTKAAKLLEPHAGDSYLAKVKYEQAVGNSKELHTVAMADLKKEAENKHVGNTGVKVSESDAILNVLDDVTFDSPAPDHMWDDYLSASLAYKKNPTPANLKKLTAAQSALTKKGVTTGTIQDANSQLFKQLGLSKPPAKKTVAQKVAQKAPTAPPASPGAPVAPVPEINLPGPGMYADGKAIKAAEEQAAKMTSGPKKDAELKAIINAKIKFKDKHGVNYAGDKAGEEVGYTGGYGGGYDDQIKDSFFADAEKEGFKTVHSSESANGDWTPSKVPGLTSNAGGYHYSGGAYTKINAQLRKHKSPTGGANDKAIAQMDKEFAAVPPLDHGIVTIRQMSNDGPFPGNPPPMEPGAVFMDHGYSSTSKKTGTWNGDVVMQVRIPKGAKVLDLNHTTGSQHSGEQEILLNRGTKFKIVSDSKSGGTRKIVVEVVA